MSGLYDSVKIDYFAYEIKLFSSMREIICMEPVVGLRHPRGYLFKNWN